jgi:DNA mismatch endonuclease (patch repair protein)
MTPQARRRVMQAIRKKDTEPELAVRRIAYALGYRYRLHDSSLPGTPDLVFRRQKKVIFVHGCWWHRHDCSGGRKTPTSNTKYWAAKFRRNIERDANQLASLDSLGWRVLVVWECEIGNHESVASLVEAFLDC